MVFAVIGRQSYRLLLSGNSIVPEFHHVVSVRELVKSFGIFRRSLGLRLQGRQGLIRLAIGQHLTRVGISGGSARCC